MFVLAIIIGSLFLYQHLKIFDEMAKIHTLNKLSIDHQIKSEVKSSTERELIINETLNISKNLKLEIKENSEKLDTILEILNSKQQQ